jgi:nucleoside-diphosphate-sugar epimerase
MAGVKRVLITGVTGLIGGVILADLRRDHEVTGLARRPMEGTPHFEADISDYEAMLPAFEGQDVVVHLTASASVATPWESALKNNIVGTRNVYQACVDSGVRRVVFASSNHITGLYENDPPYSHITKGEYDMVDAGAIPHITHESPIRPDNHYGVSKAYGEALGMFHSEEHGLSVSCLRIGSLRPIDNPFGGVRFYATWQSHTDLAQQVRKSLERDIGFGVFYGVSDNKWRFWDIDHARDIIGYRPLDNAEDHRAAEK